MTQDVQQWLTEIQSLQQRLADVSQERTAAYEQLSRWQRAYQTEAQQRRKDLRRLQTVIYRLDRENKRLKHQLGLPPDARSPFFMSNEHTLQQEDPNVDDTALSSSSTDSDHPSQDEWDQSLQPSPTPDSPTFAPNRHTIQLQQKLKETLAECDRLSKALSQEQSDHEQTRQTLMTALGDTVEQLERERQRHGTSPSQPQLQEQSTTGLLPAMAQGHSSESIAQQPVAGTPLSGQPQKQLAPARPPDLDPD